jgi:hypothetical protein
VTAPWLERLVRDLNGEGATVTAVGRGLRISGFHGRPIEPPIELVLTGQEFTAHLEAMAPDSAAGFPDVDPVTAAYRLFLVHLDETIITKAMPGSRITLVNGTLHVDPERPPDRAPDLDPAGEYVWAGEPPGGRRRRR